MYIDLSFDNKNRIKTLIETCDNFGIDNFSFDEFTTMSDYTYKYELSLEDSEYWELIVTIDKLSMFEEDEEEFVKKLDYWEIINDEFYYIVSSEDLGLDDLYYLRGIKKDPRLDKLAERIKEWIPKKLNLSPSDYDNVIRGFYDSFGVKAIPMFDSLRETTLDISNADNKVDHVLSITVDENIFRLWNDNKEYIAEEIGYSLDENEFITLEVKESEFVYFE